MRTDVSLVFGVGHLEYGVAMIMLTTGYWRRSQNFPVGAGLGVLLFILPAPRAAPSITLQPSAQTSATRALRPPWNLVGSWGIWLFADFRRGQPLFGS